MKTEGENQFKEKPRHYTVLPAEIRYDNELSSTAKVLYSDIAGMTWKEGYCYASNEYLAWLQNISVRQVSKSITKLAQCGHIKIEYTKDKRRRIFVKEEWNKSSIGVEQKFHTGVEQKFLHNNIKYNNINNNYNKNGCKTPEMLRNEVDHDELERMAWASIKEQAKLGNAFFE